MQNQHSPAFQELLAHVEAALIQAGKNARKLSEQTGTPFVTVEQGPQQKGKSLDTDTPVTSPEAMVLDINCQIAQK